MPVATSLPVAPQQHPTSQQLGSPSITQQAQHQINQAQQQANANPQLKRAQPMVAQPTPNSLAPFNIMQSYVSWFWICFSYKFWEDLEEYDFLGCLVLKILRFLEVFKAVFDFKIFGLTDFNFKILFSSKNCAKILCYSTFSYLSSRFFRIQLLAFDPK